MKKELPVPPFVQHAIGGLVCLLLLPAFLVGVVWGACRLAFRIGFNLGHNRFFQEMDK